HGLRAVKVRLNVLMPILTDFDILVRAQREILLADQRLKKLDESIQPAFSPIWALVVSVGIADEHGAGAWGQHRVRLLGLIGRLTLVKQKRDLCIADCRLCFICFDEPQEMHSAKCVAGNNRPSIWNKSATEHGALSDENDDLFTGF